MRYICARCRCTDVQAAQEDDAVIDVVGKKSYSMVLGSAFVLGVDVQVTIKDDAVIG